MARIKTNHKGSNNPSALLDDIQVATIRTLYKEGSYKQSALATTFGVNQSTICRITRRDLWRSIK
jgi:DNA-binding XRE family transcriptional regulator